jgi:hypothetical protein
VFLEQTQSIHVGLLQEEVDCGLRVFPVASGRSCLNRQNLEEKKDKVVQGNVHSDVALAWASERWFLEGRRLLRLLRAFDPFPVLDSLDSLRTDAYEIDSDGA